MTRNPSVALTLALALSGVSARAQTADLGRTADGKVIIPPGIYGPFQPGTACYAGTAGCTPKVEPVPSSGPGSFSTTVGALQDVGAMQQKEAKDGAAAPETPASPPPVKVSEEVLPSGVRVTHFSNGDIAWKGEVGPPERFPDYLQQKESAKKDCAMFAGSCKDRGATNNFAANSAPPPPDGAAADAEDDGSRLGNDLGRGLINPPAPDRGAGPSAASVADNRRQYDDINRQATTASSEELAGSLTYLKLRDFATGKTSPAKRALDESAARGAADPGAAIDDGANDQRRGNSRFFGR